MNTQKDVPIMSKALALSDLAVDTSEELLMLPTSKGCNKLHKEDIQTEQMCLDSRELVAHSEDEKRLVEYPHEKIKMDK